jgi:uncharacterized OB-fold protein
VTAKPDRSDVLRLEYLANFEYSYAAGQYASRFMEALRDEARLHGTKCEACDLVLVPPRPICGRCGGRTSDWVEVGPTGVITGYTVVEVPFIDPMTGVERPIPYGFAFIQLDGASTNIYHFLEEYRHDHIDIGMKVEAVFKPPDERDGTMADIIFFRAEGTTGDE